MLTAVYNYPECGYRPAVGLKIGEEYPVESVTMGQSSTYFQIIGLKGYFNSVQFEFFEDGKPIDLYSSPKYNPYLQRRGTAQ